MNTKNTTAMISKQVVLISAGASGIGRVIAETFLAQDCHVHIFDVDADAIADFLNNNPTASATTADVSIVAEVGKVFDDLHARYGRLDLLVNNAGIAGPTDQVQDISPPDWDRTIAVNLNGNFNCTRMAIPMLKDSVGSIINIASCLAFSGCPGRAPYTASKWAIVGLTKTLAMELGSDGIRVNAICPGSVEGDRINAVIEREAEKCGQSAETIRNSYLRQSSLRTFVTPQDVANLALFLASAGGSKISGQVIGVDGHTETLANWFD